jgi:hypothetical protein
MVNQISMKAETAVESPRSPEAAGKILIVEDEVELAEVMGF